MLTKNYLIKEKVIDTIRAFFKGRGFHEVFTPILVSIPSCEPNLEVFETELRTATGEKSKKFLILSPEYSLKKLISAGLGNIFEITKCFRNEEEVSPRHNPEFTMIEWYRVNADYTDIMKDFEDLFVEIIGKNKFTYQGEEYDITRPWPRISFAELGMANTPDEEYYKKFFNEVEPKLKASHKPAFIYDYPISQAALARPKASDPRFAERFEVFLAGLELGNCFSELTDAAEQEKRFTKELAERKSQGKTVYPMDKDLIEALKTMPPTAGIAVGVDRLIMLAADAESVAETLFFPASEE
jgi:elongation factor P--(R)-beta-lysine ligase